MSNSHLKSTVQACGQGYSRLIGVPYETLDCWGIVREFYSIVYQINLQAYYSSIPETRDEAKQIIYNSMKDFDCVNDRKFGDIILIKLCGVESHIAVFLGDGKILHTHAHSGCVIESINRWEKRVVGFYRMKK